MVKLRKLSFFACAFAAITFLCAFSLTSFLVEAAEDDIREKRFFEAKKEEYYYKELFESWKNKKGQSGSRSVSFEEAEILKSLRVLAQTLAGAKTHAELALGIKNMFCHSSDYTHLINAQIFSEYEFQGPLSEVFHLFSYIPSRLQQGDFTEGDYQTCLQCLRDHKVPTFGWNLESSSSSNCSTPLNQNDLLSSYPDVRLDLIDKALQQGLVENAELWEEQLAQYVLWEEQNRLDYYAREVIRGAHARDVDTKMKWLFNEEKRHRGTFLFRGNQGSLSRLLPGEPSAYWSDDDTEYQRALYRAFCNSTNEKEFIKEAINIALEYQDRIVPNMYMIDDDGRTTNILKPLWLISLDADPGKKIFDLYMGRLHVTLFRHGRITESDIHRIEEEMIYSQAFDRLNRAYETAFYSMHCGQFSESAGQGDTEILEEYDELRRVLGIESGDLSQRHFELRFIKYASPGEIAMSDNVDIGWAYLVGSNALPHPDESFAMRLVGDLSAGRRGPSSSRSFVYCGEVKDHLPARELLEKTTDADAFLANQADKLGEPTVQGPSSLDLSASEQSLFYTKLSVDEAQRGLDCFLDAQRRLSTISTVHNNTKDMLQNKSLFSSSGMDADRRVQIVLFDTDYLPLHHAEYQNVLLDTLESLICTKYSDLPTVQQVITSLIQFVNRCTNGESILVSLQNFYDFSSATIYKMQQTSVSLVTVQQLQDYFVGDFVGIVKVVGPFVLRFLLTPILKKEVMRRIFIPYALRPILSKIDSLNVQDYVSHFLSFFKKHFVRSYEYFTTTIASGHHNVKKLISNREDNLGLKR